MLTLYTTRLQTILHDFNSSFYGSPLSLTSIINQARDKVSVDGQCVRVLAAGGTLTSANFTLTGGSGYTSVPTVNVSAPDISGGQTAIITVTISGGAVNSFAVTNGGTGYLNVPTVTLSGGGGTGATLITNSTSISAACFTNLGQEIYNFSSFTSVVQAANSGVNYINQINNISISQGTVKPAMYYMDWPSFQAWCRINNGFVQNYPCAWSQYGTGQNGSFYLFPVPSGQYMMELDCFCVPIDLVNDSTVEAIPYPFTEAVPYYAAYLCYEYAQRNEDAERMYNLYMRKIMNARSESNTTRIPDLYEDAGDY